MDQKSKFSTLPVFLTAISTILGAVMFLRFGFAVGSVGFMGTLLIIFIENDTLVIYGRTEALQKLERRLKGKKGNQEHTTMVKKQNRVQEKEMSMQESWQEDENCNNDLLFKSKNR